MAVSSSREEIFAEDDELGPLDDDENAFEPYRIVMKATAAQRLEAVESRQDRFVLRSRIAGLVADPRPHSSEGLPGYGDRCRLRHQGYRVLYSIDEAQKIVTIVAIVDPRCQNTAG